MASVKLVFQENTLALEELPKSFKDLKKAIGETFGEVQPSIQYRDEEDDLITISTELEFKEALSFADGTQLTLIVEPSKYKKSVLQELPLANSESESEEPISILQNYRKEVESKPLNAESADVSISAMPVTEENFCNTNINTQEKASATQVISTQDQSCGKFTNETGSDALEVSQRETLTVPVEKSSVGVETKKVEMKSTGLSTEVTHGIGVNATEPRDQMLETLREVVREELQKSANTLRISGILVKHQATCEHCSVSPIVGIRYYCPECAVSFCEVCENQTDHPHDMYKMRKPETLPKCVTEIKDFEQLKKSIPQESFQEPLEESKSSFDGKKLWELVAKFKEMGFEEDNILQCLVKANYDEQTAINMLLG